MAEDLSDLKAIVEALIFASPDPMTQKTLVKVLDGEPEEHIVEALAALKAEWGRGGGLQLIEVAGGYQIVTRPELNEWVRRLFHEHSAQRLSVQALETLAVIAYRQPVTGPEVTEIRGVNTSGVLGTLLERRLIKVTGRKAVIGRPVTVEFAGAPRTPSGRGASAAMRYSSLHHGTDFNRLSTRNSTGRIHDFPLNSSERPPANGARAY